jgi:hypothetical protein
MADRNTAAHQELFEKFLATRRAQHGDLRMEVDPVAVAPVDPPKPTEPEHGVNGFPADTAVAEMTVEQQAAYWKTQSRKHEGVAKSRADYDSLKEKAQRHDELEQELMSDKDRAVADAKKAAAVEATSTYMPRLVSAEFRAAAAGRIEPERLSTILEPLDMSKFLTDNGDVDTDKVTAFVNGIAPVTGAGTRTPPPAGPTSRGLGQRSGSAAASVASGRELYRAQRKS